MVSGDRRRPVLFLDVDGPLIPFGGRHPYPSFGVEGESNPLLGRVDPAHGGRLRALACELVWATSWGEEANEVVGPWLGLPRLAAVGWPEPGEVDEWDKWEGLHWKTRALVTWAAGRAFVWVDDEIGEADREWVAWHHEGAALLHRVDPRRGLDEDDYFVLRDWLRTAGEMPSDL